MYVGGHGLLKGKKEDDMWVKKVTKDGVVTHHSWKKHYLDIAKKLNVTAPGYVTHEAVEWSDEKNKWFFLPRKLSHEAYDRDDPTHDETESGTNKLISASDDFSDINVVDVGTVEPTRGFASFKFVPGTDDNVAMALKSVEMGGYNGKDETVQTYVTFFEVDTGKVLMDDQLIENQKYEGLVFV